MTERPNFDGRAMDPAGPGWHASARASRQVDPLKSCEEKDPAKGQPDGVLDPERQIVGP
jgi:hypothetical protein